MTNATAGCYTCRLRRKKCDEGKIQCKACRHLGLQCEYKRPLWWSNNDQRRIQKENIKAIIKRTKTQEKCAAQMAPPMGADTPPGLSYSLPTSATYSVTPGTRAPSVDDQYSPGVGYDFSQPPEACDSHAQPHVFSPSYDPNPYFHPYTPVPYEVDIKTESQMFVNDIPTRKDSSTSTYSTWHPPAEMTPLADNEWVHEGIFENTDLFVGEEGPEVDFFAHQPPFAAQNLAIDVDERDRPLLNHFIENVQHLLFPVLEVNRPGLAQSELVLPSLATNRCYLHCCLSIAAEHLKSTRSLEGQEAEDELMRIRGATVNVLNSELQKESLGQPLDYRQLLDATLAMTLYKCSVGRPDETLLDIPWHGHFQLISDLVKRLQLEFAVEHIPGHEPQTPVCMTQTTWIDILGATMKARNPLFAASYREKFQDDDTSGLRTVMGCEDKVMYLISEIACLDAIKVEGRTDDYSICQMIRLLGHFLDSTTPQPPRELRNPIMDSGLIDPVQLSENITAIFRIAARIYLVGLVPDHTDTRTSIADLVNQMADAMEFIPSGPHGFDRSVVWPLLIAGSASTPSSRLRKLIPERVAAMGGLGEYGSFGRMVRVLQEVWRQSDEGQNPEENRRNVHWRDVMQQHEGWQDFLLI